MFNNRALLKNYGVSIKGDSIQTFKNHVTTLAI